jgi:hypothetical protein
MRQTAVNKFRNNTRLRTAKTVDKAKLKAPQRSLYILIVVCWVTKHCSGWNTLSDMKRNNLKRYSPENTHFIQHTVLTSCHPFSPSVSLKKASRDRELSGAIKKAV